MDITKLSTGVGGYPEPEVAKSNVIPIRPSKAEASAALKESKASPDRFTRSSGDAETADGISDRVTLSSVGDLAGRDAARDARVAGVIAAVQSGTYRVDSKSVANALLSRMLNSGADADQESAAEEV